jgi:hypothetical protein
MAASVAALGHPDLIADFDLRSGTPDSLSDRTFLDEARRTKPAEWLAHRRVT